MYSDTILKYNHLKQAHTNTIYNIFEEKLYFQIRNDWENFSIKIILKSKICNWVKNLKKFENDKLETTLDQ